MTGFILEKNIATVFKTRLSLKGKTEGPLTRRRRENAAEVCKINPATRLSVV